jgi:hypothetical protein
MQSGKMDEQNKSKKYFNSQLLILPPNLESPISEASSVDSLVFIKSFSFLGMTGKIMPRKYLEGTLC